MPDSPAGAGAADHGSAPDRGRYRALVVATALATTGVFVAFTYLDPFLAEVTGLDPSAISPVLFLRGLAGVIGVALIGIVVDRNPWLAMLIVIGLQATALGAQYRFGSSVVPASAAIALTGLTFAALAAVLGARVLVVAPGSSDMAAAGTSTAVNIGITAGALIGGLLLPAAGVRSTAAAGAIFSLAALALVVTEPAFSTARRAPSRL